MKRAALMLALLTATASTQAQSICRVYEYAELKDMPVDALREKYCDYDRAMLTLLRIVEADSKAGRPSQRALVDANTCAQELGRIERLLIAKKDSKPTCVAPAKP